MLPRQYPNYFDLPSRRAILALLPLLVVGAIVWAVNSFRKDAREEAALKGKAIEDTAVKMVEAPATMAMPSAPFDPNTADSVTMKAYGLSAFVASNIVKYREAGGSYRSAEDLRRIYGMTDEMMARIAPYVRCAARGKSPQQTAVATASTDDAPFFAEAIPTAEKNSDTIPHVEKNHLGQLVELNEADTTMLQRIPGIGSYRAALIVRYREQLGGFVRMEQLWEIEGLPESLGDWVSMTPNVSRKLDVNHSSYQQLSRHPYMGHYRARAIIDYRRQNGNLVGLQQLRLLTAFSEEDVKRLEPYLDF